MISVRAEMAKKGEWKVKGKRIPKFREGGTIVGIFESVRHH